MTVKEISHYLESIAHRSLQESYDNSGLLVGSAEQKVEKALVSLDVTEAVVEEAVERKCQLIIAHHPLIFTGIKSLTGKNYVERSIIKAIQNNIAIYAIHTNLDNVHTGVNRIIGEKLGLSNMRILAPKSGLLKKLVVFVPHEEADSLSEALFAAGAGRVGAYDECSYALKGTGSFRGSENSQPSVGKKGERHYEPETRLEYLVEQQHLPAVLSAMWEAHPYEEVAHDIYPLENIHQQIGAGMIGEFHSPRYALDFLYTIKKTFGGVVRHTALVKDEVRKIAWCGGSGSFLLPQAMAAGADVFISSDFKYHQFFEAENRVIIADIGHYENEQYTLELIAKRLREKFSTFAVLLTENSTNPINYI